MKHAEYAMALAAIVLARTLRHQTPGANIGTSGTRIRRAGADGAQRQPA